MDLGAHLHRLLSPIRRRLAMVLSRGLLQQVDDTKKLQLLRVSLGSGEVQEVIERLQQYGLTSVPESGEVLLGFFGGNRSNGVAIVVDDSSSRKTGLEPGDVALYRKGGDVIHLKDNGIEITSSHKVIVKAPEVVADSPSVKLGQGALRKLVTEDLITIFNNHVHTGVTTGPGSSGPPATPLSNTICTSNTEAS